MRILANETEDRVVDIWLIQIDRFIVVQKQQTFSLIHLERSFDAWSRFYRSKANEDNALKNKRLAKIKRKNCQTRPIDTVLKIRLRNANKKLIVYFFGYQE